MGRRLQNDLRTLIPVVIALYRDDDSVSNEQLSEHLVQIVMKLARPAMSRGAVLRREGIGNGVREVPEAEAPPGGGSGSGGPGG